MPGVFRKIVFTSNHSVLKRKLSSSNKLVFASLNPKIGLPKSIWKTSYKRKMKTKALYWHFACACNYMRSVVGFGSNQEIRSRWLCCLLTQGTLLLVAFSLRSNPKSALGRLESHPVVIKRYCSPPHAMKAGVKCQPVESMRVTFKILTCFITRCNIQFCGTWFYCRYCVTGNIFETRMAFTCVTAKVRQCNRFEDKYGLIFSL